MAKYLFSVTDWGTNTDSSPSKIERDIYQDEEGFYIYTPASFDSGVYSIKSKKERITAQELTNRFNLFDDEKQKIGIYEHNSVRKSDKFRFCRPCNDFTRWIHDGPKTRCGTCESMPFDFQ